MSEVRARRQRRTRAQWQEIIRRGEVSGQSVETFCAAESVSPASYYLWRKRLAAQEVDGTESATTPARFVELGPVTATPRGWDVELELGREVVLRLRRC